MKQKTHKFGETTRTIMFMGYEQSTRTGGKWANTYLVMDYEDIAHAASYKSIRLKCVRKSELIVPQVDDPTAPLIFPLVENIVRFPFEKRLTMSQQDADNRKRVLHSPAALALAIAPLGRIDDQLVSLGNDGNAAAPSTPMAASSGSSSDVAAASARASAPADTWELQGKQFIRHHNTPRIEMFSPQDSPDDCPIPIKYIDVWRHTETDLEHEHERSLHDVWVGDESDKGRLSGQWVGAKLLEKPPKPGYMWASGRHTRIERDSLRPVYLWVEDWARISKNKTVKQQILHEWITSLKPRMLLARKNRGIVGHVSADDLDDYNEKLKAAQDKYAVNAAPSMYLAKESIDTITDMATRLSIHEDVLRAYMGITDDAKEQDYICALQ